jgi:hypothetical protein
MYDFSSHIPYGAIVARMIAVLGWFHVLYASHAMYKSTGRRWPKAQPILVSAKPRTRPNISPHGACPGLADARPRQAVSHSSITRSFVQMPLVYRPINDGSLSFFPPVRPLTAAYTVIGMFSLRARYRGVAQD